MKVASTLLEVAVVLPFATATLLILLGMLLGRYKFSGIWRDSFDPAQFSPARLAQSITTFLLAAWILGGLAKTEFQSFAPIPRDLAVAAAGGNLIYLATKIRASLSNLPKQF